MEDLLLWSKSQMKNFTPQYRSVKLAPLLSQEIELFEEQIREKELRINLNVSPEISQNTDENFLRVILRNLLQNAINQCDKEAMITIHANTHKISITNPSLNNSAAELNSIMQRPEINSKSTGLGLQIVKDLARKLNVKIFYEQRDAENVSAIVAWN